MQFYSFRNFKDNCLHLIEKISGRINVWAWTKRWGKRDPDEWIKGYREWKKRKCPHN